MFSALLEFSEFLRREYSPSPLLPAFLRLACAKSFYVESLAGTKSLLCGLYRHLELQRFASCGRLVHGDDKAFTALIQRPQIVGCTAFWPMSVSQCQPPLCIRIIAVCKDSVRRKIAPCGRFAGLCGQSSISCGPTPRPCGDFPIRAGVFRSVRAKSRVFDGFLKNPNGISSFSPALADEIGLRRVSAPNGIQPYKKSLQKGLFLRK